MHDRCIFSRFFSVPVILNRQFFSRFVTFDVSNVEDLGFFPMRLDMNPLFSNFWQHILEFLDYLDKEQHLN